MDSFDLLNSCQIFCYPSCQVSKVHGCWVTTLQSSLLSVDLVKFCKIVQLTKQIGHQKNFRSNVNYFSSIQHLNIVWTAAKYFVIKISSEGWRLKYSGKYLFRNSCCQVQKDVCVNWCPAGEMAGPGHSLDSTESQKFSWLHLNYCLWKMISG